MKVNLFSSSFLCLGICIWLVTDFLHGQKLEDKNNYYERSTSDSLSITDRVININRYFNLAQASKNDSLIYKGFMQKTFLHAKAKQLDSAIGYSKKFLELSVKRKDTHYIVEALNKLYIYNKRLGLYTECFKYANRGFLINASIKDSLEAGRNLLSMANILKGIGDYSGSQETAIDALKYLTDTSDKRSTSSAYHIISVALKEQKNYRESLKWNAKAVSMINNETNSTHTVIYKNTRANILAEQKNYNRSISILKNLLKNSAIKSNSTEKSRILSNLGRIKWLQNPTNPESEGLLLQALQMRKEINSISGLVSSNIHLSKYYQKINPKVSFLHVKEALENAKVLKNPVSILEALDLIIPLKTKLGLDLREEAVLYSKTRGELSEIQQKARSIYAAAKYDNDSLTNANLILRAEKSEKEKQNFLYLTALLATLMVSVFIVYYKNQQRKRASLEAAHKTEIRFAKKIHDEVGNDIFYLMTQIKKNPDILKNKESITFLEGLDSVYQKARDITREYTPIKTDDTYSDELMALLNSYGSDSVKIATTELAPKFWNALSKGKKIQLFWIIRELFTNMRKHSKATFVGITFSKTNGKLEIKYIDNGVGFRTDPKDFGNGLNNVENRMRDLNGSITFDSKPDEGLSIRIIFPI